MRTATNLFQNLKIQHIFVFIFNLNDSVRFHPERSIYEVNFLQFFFILIKTRKYYILRSISW